MMVPDPVELRMDMAANGTNVEPVHQIVFEKEPLFTRLLRKVKKGNYLITNIFYVLCYKH